MFKSDEVKVTYIPQCLRCKYNIELKRCKQFSIKPQEYGENQKRCPKFQPK